jgi:hypothetical protein
MKCVRFLAFVLLASSLLAGNARATILSFEVNLDGLQEVPPNAGPGFGSADLTLDDSSGLLSITSGSYQDLLGGATAVTLNGPAPAGTNAAILLALTLDTPGATTGTFSGGGILPSNIPDVAAGKAYINIRSQVFPSGEIRGQLFAVPEPSTLALLTLGGVIAFAVKRLSL